MSNRETYMPGPAAGAEVQKDGEKWTLILVRELTLWHNIDRRYISWGAAGWHICFDVLERLLAGEPIGRIVGAEATKSGGWQRLTGEYAKAFGVPTPGWPANAPKP